MQRVGHHHTSSHMPMTPPLTPPLTPVLREAALAQRVVCGVMDCAKMLRCNYDSVMLCVLPEVRGQHDVTLDIQHTLIEAFCRENHISVIKVSEPDRLCAMLCQEDNASDITAMDDLSCILIVHPPAACPTSVTSECRGRRPSLYSTHTEVPP